MLPFFPTPYPDEILYSVIVRYHIRSGHRDSKATLEDLFGSRQSVVIDLPSGLNFLCNELSPASLHTPQTIIENLTLFPFYRPFIDKELAARVKQEMITSSHAVSFSWLKAGLQRSGVYFCKNLRLCPLCVQSDQKRYGEAYWHRAHQLPGIYVCSTHGSALHDTQIDPTTDRYRFIPLDLSMVENTIPTIRIDEITNHDLLLAQSAQWLLNNEIASLSLTELAERYMAHLKQQDFANCHGSVFREKTTSAFNHFYDAQFLKRLGCEIEYVKQDYSWLDRLFAPTRNMTSQPIHHLLAMNFLGLTPGKFFLGQVPEYKPFGDGPWPCLNKLCNNYQKPVIHEVLIRYDSATRSPVGTFVCDCGFTYSRKGPDADWQDRYRVGLVKCLGHVWESELVKLISHGGMGVTEIARKMQADPSTVAKHLKRLKECRVAKESSAVTTSPDEEKRSNYRSHWLEAVQHHPGKSMTALGKMPEYKAAFNWLLRNDKAWLNLNIPTVIDNSYRFKSKVDWPSRDKRLAEEINRICSEMLAKPGKPEQLTRQAIAKRLGIVNLLRNEAEKLPETKAILARRAETTRQFQLRRINYATQSLLAEGKKIDRWAIIERAGLQRSYKELITEIDQAIAGVEQSLLTALKS